MKIFYVYELVDPDTMLPFYIGKGSGKRHLHHLADSKREIPYDKNKHKINTIRKILLSYKEPIVNIVFETQSEEEALQYESVLIEKYGRKINDSGILTNLRDKDFKLSGYTYKIITRNYEGSNNPFYGKNHSEETKETLRKKLSGKNSPRYGKENGHLQKEKARQNMLQNNPSKKGEENACAKLTEKEVIEIKNKIKKGEKNSILSKEYNVSSSTIADIKMNRTWKHV